MNITTFRTWFIDNRPFLLGEKINLMPEYYEALREQLKVKKIVGKKFIRLGKPSDGGYVMVNNFNASGGGYRLLFRH